MDNNSVIKPRLQKQHITDILNINITPARCATHLKNALIDNKDMEKSIKELRIQLNELAKKIPVEAPTGETELAEYNANKAQHAELKSKITKLSKQIIRLSNDTSTIIAIIADNVINELVQVSYDKAIVNNKSSIDPPYIISCMSKQHTYYSVYNKLNSFNNYTPDNIKKVKRVKNADKKEKVKEKVVKQDNKLTFISYVEKIIKKIKTSSSSKEEKIKFEGVKEFLSNLIIEMIQRFITLSKIMVYQIASIRTININYIKVIMNMSMKDEYIPDNQIEEIMNGITEKINTYHQFVKNDNNSKKKQKKAPEVTTEENNN